MKKVHEFLGQLGHEDLLQLRDALLTRHLHSLVDARIRAFENPTLVCPVCERPVSEEEDIVLVFGSKDLRTKARFCGEDCLKYYLASRANVSKTLNTPPKTSTEGETCR